MSEQKNTASRKPYESYNKDDIAELINSRLAKLRESFTEKDATIDALLVTYPANVRYLSNFSSPEDGTLLVTKDKAILMTDGRYSDQAAEEVTVDVAILTTEERVNWEKYLAQHLPEINSSLGIEAHHMNVAKFNKLEKNFKENTKINLIGTQNKVEKIRQCKDEYEIAALARAADLTDAAFTHILDFMKVGMPELKVGLELEHFMRSHSIAGSSASGISFDIIVASGARSAMPHGVASSKTIAANELVTLDFGAVVGGYHADMTRTVAMGSLSEDHKTIYNAVLASQNNALAAIQAGKEVKDIDGVARAVLAEYNLAGQNLADYFVHSLGHGVGLDIHEAPGVGSKSSVKLEPNMAITIEPGAYLPQNAGVRIEDLVIVKEDGYELLSHSDKTLIHL